MKNIENIAVRGYMTKEVDVRAQILFLIIPIAGYYAWYRINKLRWGFAINLGTSLLIVPLLFMQVTNLFFFATVISLFISVYCMMKWTTEYNLKVREDIDKEN